MSDVDQRHPRPARPEWYLRLLGGFELRTRAGVAHLSPPQQHLVALTALRRVTRERTALLLWPDVDGVRAQARLRTAMWRLRKTCPGVLDVSGDAVQLSPRLAVDVHDLASGVGSGLVDLRGPAFDAHSSWELLPGWDEEWVVDERERCRQLCLHGLEREGRRLLRQGNHAAAIDVALALVGVAPLRDSAHRLVIEIHLAEGNAYEAIQAFHRYRRLLRIELGLEPSPMIRGLLAGHGVPDGAGHPGVTALADVRSGRAGIPATT